MHGAGQDDPEAAGEEAAGPAPAPAPDVKGLGAAPAGRAPEGVQGSQCWPGQRSQEQELSGKGTACRGCRGSPLAAALSAEGRWREQALSLSLKINKGLSDWGLPSLQDIWT